MAQAMKLTTQLDRERKAKAEGRAQGFWGGWLILLILTLIYTYM